jgi:CHRD domain-containing protein
MRRTFLYGLMTALLVVGATTAPRAQGGKQTLVAVLSGGSEAPNVVNTGAYGKAVITIDPAAGEVTWVIDVFNFPAGLTASHIHAGAAGTAGPIIIDFKPGIIGVSGPFQLSGSTKDFIARPAAGIRSMEEAMIAIAAGNAYVNVHSQANPGGEIRGQLCPAKASDNSYNAIAICSPIPQQ